MNLYPTIADANISRLTAALVCATALVCVGFSFTPFVLIPALLLAGDLTLRSVVSPKSAPWSKVAMWVSSRFNVSSSPVSARPKRFAASLGAVVSTTALVTFMLGFVGVAMGLWALLAVLAFAEAAFGFCAGCVLFSSLIKLKVFAPDACPQCDNISMRSPKSVS